MTTMKKTPMKELKFQCPLSKTILQILPVLLVVSALVAVALYRLLRPYFQELGLWLRRQLLMITLLHFLIQDLLVMRCTNSSNQSTLRHIRLHNKHSNNRSRISMLHRVMITSPSQIFQAWPPIFHLKASSRQLQGNFLPLLPALYR